MSGEAWRKSARLVLGTEQKQCPAHARAEKTGPHCENTFKDEGKLLEKFRTEIMRVCAAGDL